MRTVHEVLGSLRQHSDSLTHCALMVCVLSPVEHPEEPVKPGKGKGSHSKNEVSQKKDESKPPEEPVSAAKGKGSQTKDDESHKTNEGKKKTPQNPWNRFQQRMSGSGLGGQKKLLSALYREEQRALATPMS